MPIWYFSRLPASDGCGPEEIQRTSTSTYIEKLARISRADQVTVAMGQLLGKLGLVRRGHTFYALRHTFETIGGESRDQVAVDAIMGHSREDMASVYRERIGDDRLRAVVGARAEVAVRKVTGNDICAYSCQPPFLTDI